ncbi:MAG: septum formation initiator family protein [Defluviitaleaceae bacterium]|nr:septum formation initiator family protein [Defluviitaleaceae bacterium]
MKESRAQSGPAAKRGSEEGLGSPERRGRDVPAKKKSRRIRWLIYLIFWAALVGSFGWLAIDQASQYSALRNEIEQVKAETERAVSAHEALERQIAFIGSDAYIEQQARERLGLVKPTEIIFRNLGR